MSYTHVHPHTHGAMISEVLNTHLQLPWREPTQERSRRRVARMLAAARTVIGEVGLDGFTMQAVAQVAEVPIGSVYQFFPDQQAVFARLFVELLDTNHEEVTARLARVSTLHQLDDAIEDLVLAAYRRVVDDPVLAEIWSAPQRNRAHRELARADTERNARSFYDTIARVTTVDLDDDRIWLACYLMCDLFVGVVPTAVEHPTIDGEQLVLEYARMAQTNLRVQLTRPRRAPTSSRQPPPVPKRPPRSTRPLTSAARRRLAGG